MNFREVLSEAGLSVVVTKGIVDGCTVIAGITHGLMLSQGIEPGTAGVIIPAACPLLLKPLTGGYAGLVLAVSDEDNSSSSYPRYIIQGAGSGVLLGVSEYSIGFCFGYTAGGLFNILK